MLGGAMNETQRLVALDSMARHLRVPARWLRAEAEAGRVPHLNADGRFLFNLEAVERVLLERAGGDSHPAKSPGEAQTSPGQDKVHEHPTSPAMSSQA